MVEVVDITILCGCERVVIPRECCLQCAYLLGIIEDVEGGCEDVREASSATDGGVSESAPVMIKAPLDANALRAVVRILRGERVSAVLEWGRGCVAELLDKDARKDESARKLEALVSALVASSYLSSPVAEDSISQHFAATVKEMCVSGRDVRRACHLQQRVLLAPDDAAYVRKLLVDASLNDLDIGLQHMSGNTCSGAWPTWPLWWHPPPEAPGVCPPRDRGDDESPSDARMNSELKSELSTAPHGPWWTGAECTPHGALCLAGCSSFNRDSPLRNLSEDALVDLVRRPGPQILRECEQTARSRHLPCRQGPL